MKTMINIKSIIILLSFIKIWLVGFIAYLLLQNMNIRYLAEQFFNNYWQIVAKISILYVIFVSLYYSDTSFIHSSIILLTYDKLNIIDEKKSFNISELLISSLLSFILPLLMIYILDNTWLDLDMNQLVSFATIQAAFKENFKLDIKKYNINKLNEDKHNKMDEINRKANSLESIVSSADATETQKTRLFNSLKCLRENLTFDNNLDEIIKILDKGILSWEQCNQSITLFIISKISKEQWLTILLTFILPLLLIYLINNSFSDINTLVSLAVIQETFKNTFSIDINVWRLNVYSAVKRNEALDKLEETNNMICNSKIDSTLKTNLIDRIDNVYKSIIHEKDISKVEQTINENIINVIEDFNQSITLLLLSRINKDWWLTIVLSFILPLLLISVLDYSIIDLTQSVSIFMIPNFIKKYYSKIKNYKYELINNEVSKCETPSKATREELGRWLEHELGSEASSSILSSSDKENIPLINIIPTNKIKERIPLQDISLDDIISLSEVIENNISNISNPSINSLENSQWFDTDSGFSSSMNIFLGFFSWKLVKDKIILIFRRIVLSISIRYASAYILSFISPWLSILALFDLSILFPSFTWAGVMVKLEGTPHRSRFSKALPPLPYDRFSVADPDPKYKKYDSRAMSTLLSKSKDLISKELDELQAEQLKAFMSLKHSKTINMNDPNVKYLLSSGYTQTEIINRIIGKPVSYDKKITHSLMQEGFSYNESKVLPRFVNPLETVDSTSLPPKVRFINHPRVRDEIPDITQELKIKIMNTADTDKTLVNDPKDKGIYDTTWFDDSQNTYDKIHNRFKRWINKFRK